MLPYCSSDASYTWMCLRGVVLGTLSLGTVVFCLYAIYIMLPACIHVSQHRPSMALVVLAALEMTCVLLRCVWVDEPKLMIAAKYCRGIQVSISCWLYGLMACDITGKRSLMYGLLMPLLVAVAVLMTADVLIMLNDPYVDCHHASWLVMSLASSTLAVSFAAAGGVVLKEIKLASAMQRHLHQTLISHHKELDHTYHQLWWLVVINMISSVLQLSYDLYITYVVGDEPCAKIFYDDDDGAIEQIVRLGLALATFVYPEWVTVYVFFWSSRHNYATHHMDVPDIESTTDDEEGSRRGLLVNDDSPSDAMYHHILDFDALSSHRQDQLPLRHGK
ncbi:hypothetical protein H257_02726 [Aphanomyces astaci]|uniref:THH1/TOM1/TOM3 domain-containing protein n=1 Tax=Aphanomyces astaci TaxID=112090 RepID=W4H599_APHAT|nr:hypothetical protein H257_02726 [Aphanomyces astaci]ETV86318.1 hypothetical protein H257_02726 [Aphanomyces astaci]|eukprot:XP_009824790.1 hypothetical protein H257_02726 [Aphanomyces astaci]